MSNLFFEKPILNSPYDHPSQHWELDKTGQPTQKVVAARRRAEFITPIPKPKKRKAKDAQSELDMGHEVSSEEQQYHSAIINGVRAEVDKWRSIPNPNDWGVTPETARLLQHWRHHEFSGVRPFFCQVEAIETAIWLIEVAPNKGKAAQTFLDHLHDANEDAKDKKAAIQTRWLPGVNNAKQHGRWAFAEFTDVYAMQKDFGDKVQVQFDAMVKNHLGTIRPQSHASA